MKDTTMDTPEARQTFLTRVREYLRELAFDLLALQHRLFDPFDPKSMPDYRKELDSDFKDQDDTPPKRRPTSRS